MTPKVDTLQMFLGIVFVGNLAFLGIMEDSLAIVWWFFVQYVVVHAATRMNEYQDKLDKKGIEK